MHFIIRIEPKHIMFIDSTILIYCTLCTFVYFPRKTLGQSGRSISFIIYINIFYGHCRPPTWIRSVVIPYKYVISLWYSFNVLQFIFLFYSDFWFVVERALNITYSKIQYINCIRLFIISARISKSMTYSKWPAVLCN